jgi:hypothetical protein
MPHLSITSRAVEHLALKASKTAKAESRALGLPVFFYDDVLGLDMMEDANGNQFEIAFTPDGDYTLIRELAITLI